jgi:hypothetical protein
MALSLHLPGGVGKNLENMLVKYTHVHKHVCIHAQVKEKCLHFAQDLVAFLVSIKIYYSIQFNSLLFMC